MEGNLHAFRLYVRNLLRESLGIEEEIDYDNLKFLPEVSIDFSSPEVANKCSTFNVEDLQKIRSWAGKKKYLDNCLTKLGAGSSRIAYLLEPTKVIKLAKNAKGVAQNEREASLKSDAMHHSSIMAHILEYDDENYFWIEMEVARKLTPKKFFEITGLKWETFVTAQYQLKRQNSGQGGSRVPDELWDNEFFYEYADNVANYNLENDLNRLSQWGVVDRDGSESVVMVDYGLDDEIYQKHYARKIY